MKIWGEQYNQSVVNNERVAAMTLGEVVATECPEDKLIKCPVSVLHGDFRLDNVIYAEDDSAKIKAVLDWEPSSVGNPLENGHCCLGYIYPPKASSAPFPAHHRPCLCL